MTRLQKITRDRKEHYMIIRGSTHQGDIANVNVHVPNNRSAKFVKQKLTRAVRRN